MRVKMFNYSFNKQDKRYPAYIFSLSSRLDNDYITRLLAMCSLFLLAVTLVMLPAYYIDARLLNNAPIWAKPIKFSLSLAIHFLTLALLAQQLDRSRRTGMLLTSFTYLAAIPMLFEQIYISIQAARERQSHYNHETDFEALMYALMGIGAINLILVSFVLGVLIWKYGNKDNSGLRLGSILGLIIGSVLTLIYAMTMANATANSHLVGETISNAKVPIVGWSREAGDLRIPHFIATHMMQILPLMGLSLDKLKCSPKVIVSLSTLILVVMSAVFFDWALAGKAVFSI